MSFRHLLDDDDATRSLNAAARSEIAVSQINQLVYSTGNARSLITEVNESKSISDDTPVCS